MPDDEAREIADAWAREHSAPAGTRRVNLIVHRMRQMTREAEDPFGLDELVDGVWREEPTPEPAVAVVGRGGVVTHREPIAAWGTATPGSTRYWSTDEEIEEFRQEQRRKCAR